MSARGAFLLGLLIGGGTATAVLILFALTLFVLLFVLFFVVLFSVPLYETQLALTPLDCLSANTACVTPAPIVRSMEIYLQTESTGGTA